MPQTVDVITNDEDESEHAYEVRADHWKDGPLVGAMTDEDVPHQTYRAHHDSQTCYSFKKCYHNP